MYAGHFAAAIAMKAREPRVPTWVLLLGVGVLDVLFGVFVPLGIERATITPDQSPGFRLDFIDWSHSLTMALVWSLVFGALFVSRSRLVAAWAAAAVFSHFALDLLMHPGDLALYPNGAAHLGFGLWALWPRGWWLFELAFILVCSAWYVTRARRSGQFGGRPLAVVGVIVALHLLNAPWRP